MVDRLSPRSASKAMRIALCALGGAMLAYAISDHPLYGGEPGFGTLQALIAALGLGVAACALLPARVAGGVLLVTVSSLVALGFAELAGEAILGPRHRPIYQPDERLIFKFVPNRRSVMTHLPANGGATVAHRINSQGFRGEELRPAGERTRVVVYGDSFIHAFYSPDEETFVARLGAALEARLGKPVEALNAGVSSYGPDQIAVRMAQELGELRPDLVVVAVFAGNDYGDLMRNKMFRLGPNGALLENRWQLDPKVRMWLELSQRESILRRALRTARGGSAGTSAEEGARFTDFDFLLAEAEREYRSFVVERDDVVTNTHIDYYSADVSLLPASASARYKVALTRAVLERIRDIAAARRVPLAFLFIPHPLDVSPGGGEWGKVDRSRFPDYDGRNQSAPLEAAATALGVPFLSLYELFRDNGGAAL